MKVVKGRDSPGEAPIAHLLRRRRARWRCAGLYRPRAPTLPHAQAPRHIYVPPPYHPHHRSSPFPKLCITLLYSITYLHVVALIICLFNICLDTISLLLLSPIH
jgi:hypothetical protein